MNMAESESLDCELRVTDRDHASLRVAGREYSGRPILDEALEERLRATPDPISYGTALFDALLPADSGVLAGYREGLALARHGDKILNAHLFVEETAPAELHALCWERLYDAKKGIALACSREVLFSRYSGVADPLGEPIRETPRLLIALACPPDLSDYGLSLVNRAEAQRAMEEALKPFGQRIECVFLDGPVTAARLSDRLIGGKFHALHLQAHGVLRPNHPVAHVVLEGPDGRADFVDEGFFSQIFEGNRSLRLVTLVACHGGAQSAADPFSGLGPELVKRGIPAVLAMRQAIRLDTAKSFAEHFYRNLARDGRVDRATNEARHQLRLSIRDSDEWATPVLFLRLRDGRLWDQGRVFGPTVRSAGTTVKWPALLTRIESGDFVPFLGPDVGRGLLLSREELATHWVAAYDGFPLDGRTDLPAVAQFVEIEEGPHYPHDKLPRILVEDLLAREDVQQRQVLQKLSLSEVIDRVSQRHFDLDPDEPHRILAELPLSTYVTTNCDGFMAAALRWHNRKPRRQHCLWWKEEIPGWYHELLGTREEPLVFHLYGSDVEPASIVLTEDDHLDFLGAMASEPNRLPQLLQGKLTESVLLFLGYDIRRLDCRVLLRGMIAPLRDLKRTRIAVLQVDPDEEDAPRTEELKRYIEGCCRGLQILVYWGSVRTFLKELRERWKARDGGG